LLPDDIHGSIRFCTVCEDDDAVLAIFEAYRLVNVRRSPAPTATATSGKHTGTSGRHTRHRL